MIRMETRRVYREMMAGHINAKDTAGLRGKAAAGLRGISPSNSHQPHFAQQT